MFLTPTFKEREIKLMSANVPFSEINALSKTSSLSSGLQRAGCARPWRMLRAGQLFQNVCSEAMWSPTSGLQRSHLPQGLVLNHVLQRTFHLRSPCSGGKHREGPPSPGWFQREGTHVPSRGNGHSGHTQNVASPKAHCTPTSGF